MIFTYADVEKEYEKDKRLKKEDIEQLQEWAQKQPHLPQPIELELIFFLKRCFYSVEQAKATIDNYFTLRPVVFVKTDANKLMIVRDAAYYVMFPEVTPEGYKVFYQRVIGDTDKYNFLDHIKYVDAAMKLDLLHNGTVDGVVVVVDFKGFTLGHVARIPLMALKNFIIYLQIGLPIRLTSIHFLNGGSVVEKIFALIRPMIKQEFVNLMHVHGSNLEDFYKYVPLKCLPKDYGGYVDSVADLQEKQKHIIFDYIDHLKEEDDRRVDESKREDKSKSIDDFFGMEGSFKKLEVD
ncbi:hypothetical protein FQA39_LY16274 [Lamprigera yunnana]|nr:hypothetical protein FQA39_LY16274 [Lamprigera yunnana]